MGSPNLRAITAEEIEDCKGRDKEGMKKKRGVKDRKGEGWERSAGGETARNSLLWSPLDVPEPSVAPFFLCYTQWYLPFSGVTSCQL